MSTQPYGNHWNGDALWNIRIGYAQTLASFKFKATKTTPITALHYYNTYSTTKPGYHSGTGGTIKIEIQTDKNGIPSGTTQTTATVHNPLLQPTQLRVPLTPTTLQQDQYYHIVFSNTDPNPDQNYVSVNTMAIMSPKKVPIASDQPELQADDMITLIKSKYNGWTRFKSNQSITPIFTLYNGTNIAYPGYGGMESWLAETKKIQGTNIVAQAFTPQIDTYVTNVAIRLGKQGAPGPLKATIIRNAKQTLASTIIGHTSVVPVKVVEGHRLGYEWVKLTFKRPVLLRAGIPHKLVLSTTKGDSYEIFPLRDGASFGYAPIWQYAWAEFSATGTSGLMGWTAWGKSNLRISHLQLYFNSTMK